MKILEIFLRYFEKNSDNLNKKLLFTDQKSALLPNTDLKNQKTLAKTQQNSNKFNKRKNMIQFR